jgi:putative aminopeptidase FrvX
MIADLLTELVRIPGPTGFEGRVASKLYDLLKEHVDDIYIDKIGNLIAKRKGSEGNRSLAIEAHMDTVSMVVQKVDDFIWFDRLGWINFRTLPGTSVLILGKDRDVPGVVCSPSAHFEGGEIELWIDVGDRQRFVSVGDPIVFDMPVRWLDDNKSLLASHSLDDRVGCSIIVELARRLDKTPRHNIYFIGGVQEETSGLGARHALRQLSPDWFIALDTGFAQDALPDKNKTVPLSTGIGVRRLSFCQPADRMYPATANFASPRLNKLLIDAANKLNIPFNVDISTRTFADHHISSEVIPETDSTLMFVARRYSHSPQEVVDINNAERAVDILCQAITDLDNWDE